MKKILPLLFLPLLACSGFYLKERKLKVSEFERVLEKGYRERKPFYLEVKGDFESIGKTYLKGFFRAFFKEGNFLMKVISPPFFVREFEDDYLGNLMLYYFSPSLLLREYKIMKVKETENFYVVTFQSAEAIFNKKNLKITGFYFKDGFMKFKDFHDGLPAFIEFSYLDEHILLRINDIYLEFK